MPAVAVGVKALRKIQFGRNADSDSDDLVACTEIWRGTGTIEDTRNLYFVNEDVGKMTGSNRTNTSLYGAALALDPIEATYEQLPHLLEMSVKAVTPTSDSGGGDGFIYTYTFPTSAIQALKPYTVQGGDNIDVESGNFVHCIDWTLAGEGGKAWMMSGNLIGKQVDVDSFDGGATIPVVHTMNFSKTKMYIDADSDTWGSTLISNTLLKATLKYNAKLVAKPTAEGVLTWSYVVPTMPDITLAITFEHNATSVAQKVNWRSETPLLIRLLNQGTAFTNPGVYTYRSMIADLAGKWLKFNKIGEMNGNDILEGTFQIKESDVQASAGQIVIVNARSTLG